MIKKIANWTFGSVFRTFGRIIAYVIFGLAVSYLLSSLDFRISDLFLDNVKAETFQNGYGVVVQYQDASHNTAFPYDNIYYYKEENSATSNGAQPNLTNFYNSMDVSDIRGGRFEAPFLISWPIISTTSSSTIYGQDYCDRWDWRSIDSYNNVIQWQCGRVSSSQDSTITDREYITPVVNLAVYVVYTDGNITYCTISNERNTISCPVPNKSTTTTVRYITISSYVRFTGSTSQTYKVGITNYFNKYASDANIIIDNQNQNTQSIIQQQENNTQQILDSNTTQAENDAQGFFDDFDVPDVGGLSAIITAPLNTIRSLLSSTCSKLILPLPYVNENLELPCMNEIYTEHFGLFFSLYQTIILAIVAYRCIRSIYFDITGFTNPDDDRIEVMDL